MRCAVRACTAHTLAAILRYVAIGCTGPCFVDVHVMGPKEATIQVSLGTSTMANRRSPGVGGWPRARRRVKLDCLGCCFHTLATVLSQAVEALQVVCVRVYVCVCKLVKKYVVCTDVQKRLRKIERSHPAQQ